MLTVRLLACALLVGACVFASQRYADSTLSKRTEAASQQLAQVDTSAREDLRSEQQVSNTWVPVAYALCLLACVGILLPDIRQGWRKMTMIGMVFSVLLCSGCRRPFEPMKLEKIEPNEEAFLIPLLGDMTKQTTTDNEAFLQKNIVPTKQVQIPQQWVQQGYETLGYNGEWRDAAQLIRVNKSPVTREWTADPNSGTSNKNEAIWVMTSDQVEFSTGWTCTARIATQADAVKFLHNYPNGSLEKVLDTEVRAKLQSTFGLEVTDLPMDTLRKSATPHILHTCDEVKAFFAERGITITNLGISGGFVYKDPTIMQMLVKVFNAEQEKNIATAESLAQEQRNKTVQFTAEGKGKALLTEKQAEADGIKLVADAKAYEIEKAKQESETYLALKNIENQKLMLDRWDGAFPVYFMGGQNPTSLLLQSPPLPKAVGATK